MTPEEKVYFEQQIAILKRSAEACEKLGYLVPLKNHMYNINDYRKSLGLPAISKWQDA